jgi:hypothetical protein
LSSLGGSLVWVCQALQEKKFQIWRAPLHPCIFLLQKRSDLVPTLEEWEGNYVAGEAWGCGLYRV